MNIDLQPSEWMAQAYCKDYPDPDLWHYETSAVKDEAELNAWRMAEAKRICAICPVISQCLAEGLKQENMLIFNGTEGSIWGGQTLGERTKTRDGEFTRKYKKELPMLRNVYKKIAILDQ